MSIRHEIDCWTNESQIDEWLDGCSLDGWMDGWTDGWMDGWMLARLLHWMDGWANAERQSWVGSVDCGGESVRLTD